MAHSSITENVVHQVKYGTAINVNFSVTTIRYTFTDFNGTNQIVTYTRTQDVYEFISAGWIDDHTVTLTTEITPELEQKYIYLKFNNTTGKQVVSPSAAGPFKIGYSSGSYTLNFNQTNNGSGNDTLTYTFTDATSGPTTVTYTILAEYTASEGKTANATEIEITPVLSQEFYTVTFKSAGNTDKLTDEVYNIAPTEAISIAYAFGSCGFTFTEYGSTSTTYTYLPITGYEIVSYSIDGKVFEDASKTVNINGHTEITVTSTIKIFDVTFAGVTHSSITASTTYKVKYGTAIEVSFSVTSIRYNFNDASNTANTVSYSQGSGANDKLYEFTLAGWTNGNKVESNITITPTMEQKYIYVQFYNAKIGATETSFNPSRTDEFKIAYNSGSYSIAYTFTTNEVNNSELKYTLNGTTYVTYSIPAAYILTADGIDKTSTTKVTVTPIIEQAYVVLTFKATTGEAEIEASITTPLLVKYNSGDYISDGTFDWANSILSYTVTLSTDEVKTIRYKLEGNAPYTFNPEYVPAEQANVETAEVKPELIEKDYNIGTG